MISVKVTNLHDSPISLPGGYHVAPVPVGESVSFIVPSVEDFLARVTGLISAGYILVEQSAVKPKKVDLRPASINPPKSAYQPSEVQPGSPNEWEREPASDKVWPHDRYPRNPAEQRLYLLQQELDKQAAANDEDEEHKNTEKESTEKDE